MKKFLLSILTVIVFSFCLACFAGATETTQPNEQPTETEIETESETPGTPNVEDEKEAPATVEENSKEIADYVISIVTSSSFWATAASILSGAVTIVILIVRNFNNTTRLIKGKADTATVKEEIKSGVTEIGNQFTVSFAETRQDYAILKEELDVEKENTKLLTTMLITFILHSKIGTSAKGEIMKMANGIKQYQGTMTEVIEQVEEAIATAEKEEEKVETPALETISLSLN